MDRYQINPQGNWRIYNPVLPAGAQPLGTVTRPTGETGALVRLASGTVVLANAGAIRSLPHDIGLASPILALRLTDLADADVITGAAPDDHGDAYRDIFGGSPPQS